MVGLRGSKLFSQETRQESFFYRPLEGDSVELWVNFDGLGLSHWLSNPRPSYCNNDYFYICTKPAKACRIDEKQREDGLQEGWRREMW